MSKADISIGIHNTIERHTTELEQIHFLSVQQGNLMFNVRQANEGNRFITPILLKGRGRIRANSQNLDTAAFELTISITQARQLRATIWSHKATQECE